MLLFFLVALYYFDRFVINFFHLTVHCCYCYSLLLFLAALFSCVNVWRRLKRMFASTENAMQQDCLLYLSFFLFSLVHLVFFMLFIHIPVLVLYFLSAQFYNMCFVLCGSTCFYRNCVKSFNHDYLFNVVIRCDRITYKKKKTSNFIEILVNN